MKLPTCQLVPASPLERRWILSANFRKLRGGWGTLELLSVVQPSQAREARTSSSPPHVPVPPPRLRVHIFKQTYVVWEIERRRQNEGERWIQQDSEQKKKKKHPGTRWPGLWRHCCCHVMEDVHESVLVWFSVAVFAPACAEITVHPLMFKSVSVRPLMRAPVCRLWSQHCAVFICTCEVCNQPCR